MKTLQLLTLEVQSTFSKDRVELQLKQTIKWIKVTIEANTDSFHEEVYKLLSEKSKSSQDGTDLEKKQSKRTNFREKTGK